MTLSLNKLNKKQQLLALRIITHVGALIPLIWLYIDYYTYNLGADEIRAAILRTGKPALVLLVISLAITPLNTLFGWKILLPLRKPLGLYSFMYVALHLSIFAIIDYGLQLQVVWEEIVLRRYALAGFFAFLILLPLALTSTKWAQRKLGKRWKKLHRWVYLAGLLAVIHYIWLVKQNYQEPLIYAAILISLLALRIPSIKKAVASWRRQLVYRSS
ncbi:MAG: protein-methionine-sulfoxide reductase heme-binding subunit MsrQ [Ardenticatenaceae bacterium]|nr:protein-methionine-sulfoxide reductase heme-binding subunit MsrQ [Ardenticatenaceae bacterium]